MSGIVGLFYKDGRVAQKQVLQKMLVTIAARGKDRQSVICCGQAGFGHALLRTTPQDTFDNQPVICKESGLVLVADARIDNRRELFQQLALSSTLDPELPDSRLLLVAYKKWQDKIPNHIIGDFAFAVWDSNKKQLFCARDRVGVRPFYYLNTPSFFAFSSEIKALLTIGEPSCPINKATLAAYLLRTIHDPKETFYTGIHRLLPATTLQVIPGKHDHCKYWSTQNVTPVVYKKDSEYGEAFREIFQEAVNCRLRSTTPVGAALSGGLDSSSVVCTAAQQLGQQQSSQLHAYSVIFDKLSPQAFAQVNEREYIESVLAETTINHYFINASSVDPLATLDQELTWYDEPFFNPNLYLHRAMYKRASQSNQRVFLDGLDGDTVVSHGYELLPDLFVHGKWDHFLKEIRAIKNISNSQQSIARLAYHYGLKPILQTATSHSVIQKALHTFGLQPVTDILATNADNKKNIQSIINNQQRHISLPVLNARAHHCRALELPHLMYALELSNHVSARYDIEERYPFLDARLIEFCVAIPPQQKFINGWSRMVLRQAMEGILPAAVQWRLSKANLSPHFLQTMQAQPAAELLDEQSLLAKIVNTKYLQRIPNDIRNKEDILNYYTAICVGNWLKKVTVHHGP